MSSGAQRPADAVNLHATALVLGDRGLLVTGASGSGKSLLALTLVEQERAAGRYARLVADDQVFAAKRHGRLVVFAPTPIAGMAETRGFGPSRREYEPASVIDLEVEMAAGRPERHQAGTLRNRQGIDLPLLTLSIGELAGALLAIRAALMQLRAG